MPRFHRNPFEPFKGTHSFPVNAELINQMRTVRRTDGEAVRPVIGEGFFMLPKDDIKVITEQLVSQPTNFEFPKLAAKVNSAKKTEYNRMRKLACIAFDNSKLLLELTTQLLTENEVNSDLLVTTLKNTLHGSEVVVKDLKEIEAEAASLRDKSFLDPKATSNFGKGDLKRLEDKTKVSKLVDKYKKSSQQTSYRGGGYRSGGYRNGGFRKGGKWERDRPKQYGYQRGSYYDRFDRRDDYRNSSYRGGRFGNKPSNKFPAANNGAQGAGKT
jgi:hypothetical protein